MRDLNDAKHQLKSMFLRNNIRYTGTDSWSLKHLRWLTEIVLPHPCQQIVLQEMIQTISERMSRLKRLDNELTHQVTSWRYYPVVKAIQAMRGGGKPRNVVTAAIAREMIAFIWSISREVVLHTFFLTWGVIPTSYIRGFRQSGLKCPSLLVLLAV